MVFLHIDTKNYDEKDETGESPIEILNKFIKDGKHVFALIYMEGCGPCNATRPEWKKIENVLKSNMNDDDFLVVDIDKDVLDKVAKIGSEPKGFPTIRYINKNKSEDFEDSDLNEEYKKRIIDSFIMWIKKKTNNKRIKRMTGGKWSKKYKKSINCKRPKGFSQKQYCKYSRKKR